MYDSQSGPVISARDLSVQYRVRGADPHGLAVSGVTLDVAQGEILGLVGEAGAGKSTLARVIAARGNRVRRDAAWPEICGGSLTVYGRDMRSLPERERRRLALRIGYLPQDAAMMLVPHLTVAENVAEPIFERDRDFDPVEALEAVAAMVDTVRLPLGLMDALPHELSSGQRQRVALARTLVVEPTLLVADDPARGVDAAIRSEVLDVIRTLRRDRGLTAVVVSSDIAVAGEVSDRVAVMQHGILVGHGPLSEVLSTPTHAYVRDLAVAWERSRPLRHTHGHEHA